MPFDERKFGTMLGAFATGVAVVLGRSADGARLGMTVSSFNSVSLAPPLILFSIARSSLSFERWLSAAAYSVNILAEDQIGLSNRFAKNSGDKWSNGLIEEGETGIPVLLAAIASFECEHFARYSGGDHEIFVGRVLRLWGDEKDGRNPLIFFRGQYRTVDIQSSKANQEASAMVVMRLILSIKSCVGNSET